MLSFLTLSLATCSALQLGVARVPAAVRGAALRMQVPLTSDAAAAAPEEELGVEWRPNRSGKVCDMFRMLL